MGETRKACRTPVGKPLGYCHFEDREEDGRATLSMILRKEVVRKRGG
jgi:hypothetical protein